MSHGSRGSGGASVLAVGALVGVGAAIGIGIAHLTSSDEEIPLTATKKKSFSRKSNLLAFNVATTPWYVKAKDGSGVVQARNAAGEPIYLYQVSQTPSELQALAEEKLGRKLTGSIFALATMIASEQGKSHKLVRAAVAHAAKNWADAKGEDIFTLLTHGPIGADGTFGGSLGRYASTLLPPTKEDIEIAEAVMNGLIADPTAPRTGEQITGKGADHFDSPRGQRAALSRGLPGYTKTPEQVAESRSRTMTLVAVRGINPDEVRFWRTKTS